MSVEATPLRWPGSWIDPGMVDLLKDTAVNFILVPRDPKFDRVRARAREIGISASADPPSGVILQNGAWPGIKPSRGGDQGAGPTGVAWVDSNGWLIRLTRARHPDATIWVEAPPKDRRSFPAASYELAVADVAAHGGRWVISLDDQTAAKPADSAAWKRMLAAAGYFALRPSWSTYTPAAVLGVASDFTGPNEFMGQELLNLLGRAGMHYRVVMKDKPDFAGLRAILYADQQPPSPELHRLGMQFVEAGGLLLTTPSWGAVNGRSAPDQFPRFAVKAVGKGRVAVTLAMPDDPWQLANDSVVVISHRYDLVRCFNSGSFASYFTYSPDRKRALVHLLFYADRGPAEASVRIAGKFRAAALSSVAQAQFKPVPAEFSGDWVEVHLPPVPPYVALELTV